MAGNFGKFIDRAPIIRAAGKASHDDPPHMDTVPKTFREYTEAEAIDTLKRNAHTKQETWKDPRPKPPIDNKNFYRTVNTEFGSMIPKVSTRYQTLLADFEETAHDSYWNAEIGKPADQTPGLPKGMIPVLKTFGAPSKKEVSVKDLVNPPKTVYEVLWDSQVGHDNYVKTHGSYNPGEHLHRNYIAPFDSTQRFGQKSKYDYRGIWVKCCCKWHLDKPVTCVSSRQTDYIKKSKPAIGNPLTPNHNIDSVPKNHVFGKPSTRVMYGVRELISGPCLFKRDLYNWLTMLNKMRVVTKRTISKGYICFQKCLQIMIYTDKEKTGFLPKDKFYELCIQHHVRFSMKDLEPMLRCFKILSDDDMIDYKFCMDLINPRVPLPELTPIKEPSHGLYYVKTGQLLACDRTLIDNSGMPPAGLPSLRTDLAVPRQCEGIHKPDLETLADATTVKTVLNPSIYTVYGLSYRDFFLPRKRETLRTLFKKAGHNIPDEKFEKIWNEGVKQDGTGLCCVDTFKKLLDKDFPPLQIRVNEHDCPNNNLNV